MSAPKDTQSRNQRAEQPLVNRTSLPSMPRRILVMIAEIAEAASCANHQAVLGAWWWVGSMVTCGNLPKVAVSADLEPGASELRETIPAAGVVLDVEDGKGGLLEVPRVRDVKPGNHLPLRNAFL